MLKKYFDKLPSFIRGAITLYLILFGVSMGFTLLLVPVAVFFGGLPSWVLSLELIVLAILFLVYCIRLRKK